MDKLANLTHRGVPYKPGCKSPNPGGKPQRMWRLVTNALREKLAEVDLKTKKTIAEKLADVLIKCVFEPDPELDKTRIAAWEQIVDRCEGKAKQQLEVNDITSELRERSDEDLVFYVAHGRWPEDPAVQ